MFENTGASLVSWAAFGLPPTNTVKTHLSISMPGPLAQIYSPADSRAFPGITTTVHFPPSRQGSAERSYSECQCLEIQF